MSSGPPPLGKLPPPVPSALTRKASFSAPLSAREQANADVGPPTPPKPSQNGVDDPSSSPNGVAHSKSWTQLAPQKPFVNGRGNVQLPGAPQRFIPAGLSSSPSSSPALNLGLAHHGSPSSLQREGQQAYVRRSPSPGLSTSQSASHNTRGGFEGTGAPGTGMGAGTMTFPSQFGVQQRVAIRTSSRPQPRKSTSSTGSYRGAENGLKPEDRTSVHPSISSHSHLSSTSSSSSTSTVTNANSSTPIPSPHLLLSNPASPPPPPAHADSLVAPKVSVLDRPRPKTPDPFSAPSLYDPAPRTQGPIVTKRYGPRPSNSTTLSSLTHERERSSSLDRRETPASTLSSPSHSVLDRPRPKTPDPFGTSLSPTLSSTSSSRAPSTVSDSPTLLRSVTPTSTSVLDRPRPKTPEAGSIFTFGDDEARVRNHGMYDDEGTEAAAFQAPSSVFSYGASSSDGHGVANLNRSVMDRPRPRTPDPQGWLDSATTISAARSFDSRGPTSATSTASGSTYLRSSTTSLPYSTSSTSISRPSFDSTAPSYSSHATSPPSRMQDQSRSRHSSALSHSTSSDPPPLLNLDFDFGSSFSNSDTLFGLSDLISFGNDSTNVTTPTTATHSKPSSSLRSRETSATSSRVDFNASTSSVSSTNQPARSVPRKEAPKVDLQLELELEMERALPANESLGQAERRHARESSNVTDASDAGGPDAAGPESGRRTPAGFVGNAMGRIRKKGDSISSMRSFVTDKSVSEASIGTGGGGSPQPTAKRRRRRSLASLLSFASNGGKDQLDRDAEAHDRTLDASSHSGGGFAPPAALTFDPSPMDLSFDKTLPPTPISHTPADDDRTPPASAAAQQTSYRRAESGSNALTRQLSRLRQRSDQSSSSSTRSGFQVVSGSTTRNRGGGERGQGSVSSLASSQQSHSSSHRDSLDYGYSARDDSAPFTALPLSEPPTVATTSAPSHSATSSTSSLPFGRRLVQKITKLNSKPEEAAAVRSWTMPLKDHSQESTSTSSRPRKPRRGSFSSLLNFGGSGGDGVPSSSDKPGTLEKKKSLLGMSLSAGRKSDDMLARGFGRERESNSQWSGSVSETGHGDVSMGRRSFDLLTEREAIPRRQSTDNLLTLASAKLSKMTLSDENGEPLAPSPATPVGNGFPNSGELSSGQSTPSITTPDNSNPIIATAQIVRRPDGTTSLTSRATEAESPLFARTVAPILVRSDSLRASPRPIPAQQQPWKKRGKAPDSGLGSDASMSSAWLDVEDALGTYSQGLQQNHPERAQILTNTLLPFLKKEEDSPSCNSTENLAKRQRDILFGWLATLTKELKETQPAHRGACLEAVGAIVESHFLSAATLESDALGQSRFESALVDILHFAVEKLNEKAVYANTLVFSGRVFAIAFWRIEGVGIKLLRALPQVKRAGLKRILDEAGVSEHNIPPVDLEAFPPHLATLCLQDFRSYASLFLPLYPHSVDEDDKYLIKGARTSIEMSGNWLIRWTASDSDLPFSFYRAYHKQLASYLVPIYAREDVADQRPMSPASVITAPGYLFVAASLLEKTDALVHRNLRSVTSMGPNTSNFNTNDSANLSFGAKPKILELAHRRLVQTMLDIVGGPPPAVGESHDEPASSASRRHVFSRMMQVWIRASIKRTSMWDTRSVFILLDYVEALIFSLAFPPESSNRASSGGEVDQGEEPASPKPDQKCLDMFDFEFLFGVIKKILLEADNTVTLMRCIAFLYAHFEIFTLRPQDRTALCEGIILDEAVFTRLFLSYNQGTRGFWIRLLVWRLSRLGVVAKEQNPNLPPDEGILALFGLLNTRLEAIRKRHDQLEPVQDVPEESTFFRPKRSTICSTRGVKEAPWTVDELAEAFEEEDSDDGGAYEEDDSQELVRATHRPYPPPPLSSSSSVASGAGGASVAPSKGDNNKTVSKVVSWLKGGLGKNKKGLKLGAPAELERDSLTLDRPSAGDDPSFADEGRSSFSQPSAPLPTTIETGVVVPPAGRTGRDVPPATPEKNTAHLSPSRDGVVPRRNNSNASTSSSSSTGRNGSQRRKKSSRPTSPAFFSFEFENGIISRTDVDPAVVPPGSPSPSSSGPRSTSATLTPPANHARPNGSSSSPSPVRRVNAWSDPAAPPLPPGSPAVVAAAVSPRVSLRFSKRISILPPAALDLLRKEHGATAGEEGRQADAIAMMSVPPIPEQYRNSAALDRVGYDRRLHPYAIRALIDLEQSFDEWDDWVAKLQEEEDDHNDFVSSNGPAPRAGSGGGSTKSTFMDVVPRLAVSWPTSFTDD